MTRRRDILALGAASAAAALVVPAIVRAATKATLRLKWLPQSQFAGYYLALAKGFYREAGLDLDINPGGPNLLTENLVATGADTFGISGGTESVMAARIKKLPVVCTGIAHQITPFVFVARADGPIATLKDVPGHRVTAWFTGAQLVFPAMLAASGIDPKSVPVAPQQVSFTPFVEGQVDVAVATRYSDVALLKRRMGSNALRIFDPETAGITIPRDTVIVSEATARDKPDLVRAFTAATIRGWQEAKRDPQAAVGAVLSVAPTLDRAVEDDTLVEILKIMAAGSAATKGLFVVDPTVVKGAHDFLLEHGGLSEPVDLAAAFRPEFVDAIPLGQRMP